MAEKTLVVSQNISGNNLLGGGGKSKRICGDLLVVTSDFVPQLDFNIREDFILILKDKPARQPKTFIENPEPVRQKLVEAKKGDSVAVAEIYSKLHKSKGVLDKLAAKAEQRQSRLQNVLLRSQEFQVSFDEFLEKLARLEEQTARQEPVSGVYETVKEQNQEHKPIRGFVVHQEPVHEHLVRATRNVLETLESGPQKKALEDKLHDKTDRWNEVKRKTADRQEQLEQVIPLAKKYRDEKESVKPWLNEAEKKYQGIERNSYDRLTLEKNLKALRRQKEDIGAHKPDFDDLNETSPVLVNSCKSDKAVIDDGTQDLNQRYENLANGVAALEEKLGELKDVAERYKNVVKTAGGLLDKYRKLSEPQMPMGIDVKKGKGNLDKLQQLLLTLMEHKPEVCEVNSAGQELLSLMDERSPAAALVKQEMQSVNQRYQDLLDALTSRKTSLENDLVQASKFHNALHDLEEWLPEVQETVSVQEPISSDPEVFKQQLQQAEELCDDIINFKITLESLEETGKKIIEDSDEDAEVVHDVREEINKIASLIEILARKISDRQARLQSALIRCQEFQVSYDELMNKLGDIEDALAKQEPISALYETVKTQRLENEELQQTLDQQEPVFEKLVQTGLAVAESLEDEPERESLERKIGVMKKRWENAEQNVRERQERLCNVEPLAKKYHDKAEDLSVLFDNAEKNVEAFEPLSIKKSDIVRQNEILGQNKEAAKKFDPEIVKTEKAATDLKEEAERDENIVEAEVGEFIARYGKLNESLTQREEKLLALEGASDHYHVTVKQAEELFAQAYDVVYDPETFGTDTDKARARLAELQVLSVTLNEKETDVSKVGEAAETLMEKVHEESTDRLLLIDKVKDVSYIYEDLCDKLRAREAELEEEVDKSKEFNENVEELDAWLDTAREKLATQGPISTDPAAVEKQLKEIQALKAELDSYKPTLETVGDVCEWLTDKNRDEALIANNIQGEYDQLEKKYNSVKASLLDLEGNLQAAQMRTQEFQVSFDEFRDTLDEMEKMAAKQEPVSAVCDTVRRQKKEDEELSDEIQQHEPVFEQLIKRGDIVLQSTEPGDERDELEKKLDDVKKRWNDVRRKSSNHMNLVNSVVQDADKYQDAAEYLSPWLSTSEAQVFSLETIVADEESVTAREAVLNTLRDDIDRHRPDRNIIDEKSKAVIGLAQADQETVEKEAEELTERYDKLDATCAGKQEELENVVNALEQYRAALKPVNQMLDKADAVLASQGPVSGDMTKLRNMLQDIKELQEALDAAQDDVQSLNDCGEKVTNSVLSASGDPSPVQEELAAVNQRYKDLQEKLEAREGELQRALDRGLKLRNTLKEIKVWALETLKTVESWDPVSTDPDTATQQLHELEVVEDDLQQCKQDLDVAEAIVQEIIEASKEPEVESELNNQLSQAADSLEELSDKLNDRKDKLLSVITQSGEFEKDLDEFLLWLTKTERTVSKLKPISADSDIVKHQREECQRIHQKIKEKEPSYTALVEAGEKLKESSEIPADRKNLEEKLSDITFSWIELNTKSDDRIAVLNKAVVVTFEYQDLGSYLLPWLNGVEKKADKISLSCNPKVLQSSKENLEGVKQEMESHSHSYDDLNRVAKLITEICVDAIEDVKADIHDINERWKELKNKLAKKSSKLHCLQNQLMKYLDTLRVVNDEILQIEKEAGDDRPTVLDIKKMKVQFEELKASRDTLEELEPDFNYTVASGQELLNKYPDVDTSAVQQENESLQEYYEVVKNKVDEKLEKTVRLLAELEEYWDREEELEKEIKDVGEGLEQNKPREMDLEKVKEQLENTKVLRNRLEQQLLFDDVKRRSNYLIGQGRDFDSLLDKQMTHTDKQWNDVNEAVANQVTELEKALKQLEDWTETVKEADEAITTLEEKVNDLTPVGTDVDTIKEQMEQVKNLQHEISVLKENISVLTDITYKIHVAHPDADKRAIDKTVKDLKQRLPRLNSLLSDRLSKLQLALKQLKKPKKPRTGEPNLHTEIVRLCSMCTCTDKFAYNKDDDNKYKFGDSQKVRLVRIMRTTVMVRVGGGWETFEAFLFKNDPCRAEGRNNEGTNQNKVVSKSKRPSVKCEASDGSKLPIAQGKSSGSHSGAKKSHFDCDPSSSGLGITREKSLELRSSRGLTREKSELNQTQISPPKVNRSKSETSIESHRAVVTFSENKASPLRRSSGIPTSPKTSLNRRLNPGSPRKPPDSPRGAKASD